MAKKVEDMSPDELRRYSAPSLAKALRGLKTKNAGLSARLNERQKGISSLASKMGLSKGHDGKDRTLFPGNIGDINTIIWPFWFQTEIVQVDPNAVQTANINITQEAPFVATHLSLVVFEVIEDAGSAEVPAQSSVETLTFTDNNLNNHVLDFNDAKITLGVDVAIGGDLDTTLASLQTYMNSTSPFQDLYVANSVGGGSGVFTVTTVEVGASANQNNEFVYTYPNGDQDRLDSTGFVGGADLVAAVAASTTVNYINPKDQSNSGVLGELVLEIVDSQSTRTWHDEPVPASLYGDGKDPFILDNPYMILQNQNIEVRWTNSSGRILIPTMLFHGYRMRVKDAEGIMSLITE